MLTGQRPVVLTAAAVRELPEVDLTGVEDVTHRILWQDGESMAGVLRVPAGVHLGEHAHRANHHHMWVLEGRAVILGEVLGAGSYVHIPAGVDHDIDARDTDGCVVYYLYVRQT